MSESAHSFELSLHGYEEFNRVLDMCDRQMSMLIIGPYRESGGILYQGGIAVGTTRQGAEDNRLRRFVHRGRMLVEVRARGRSGKRGLQDAADI